ncbi:class I SAM-dependent methyltransferase [Patescibacteria group bacterium]|nr:class I SAM-dependent methyltransferase [Patescibacteria group bacterium]MBU1870790.1 class I SAM-dependent methyltransferase [Patescibacteria group bacterium]
MPKKSFWRQTHNVFDERLVIDEIKQENIIYNEHLIRYQFVSKLVLGKTVLDIACGSGYGSKMLAKAGAIKVIAIDASQSAIENAKKNFQHNNIEYKIGDATKTGLEKNTVDLIVSMETIEHLSDVEGFLQELARVVKDDGLVIISTPNKEVSECQNPFHFREYAEKEFDSILKKYFQYCLIIKQYNCIASCLKINNSENGEFVLTNHAKPTFFLAICSKKELGNLPICNIASLNPMALNNLYNNVGLKIVNKIYLILIKIPGMKKILEFLATTLFGNRPI